MHVVPVDTRRGYWVPLGWYLTDLRTTMGLIGIKFGSPGRATSVLLLAPIIFNMNLIAFLSGCTLEGAVFSTVLGICLLSSLGPFRLTESPKSG